MRTNHKKHLRRLTGVLTAAALTATAFAGMAFPVSAAQANWKFDLGGNGALERCRQFVARMLASKH